MDNENVLVEAIIRADVGDACYDDIRWRSSREVVERCVSAALALVTAQPNDFTKAAEIVTWWDSGVLPDGLVRAEAEQMLAAGTADEMHYIRQAEQAIVGRIVRRFAAIAMEPRP